MVPARTVVRALALLRLNDRLTAPRVATLLELTGEGVRKIARRYRESGIDEAVYEGERPGKKPVLDAAQRLKVWRYVQPTTGGTGALDDSLAGGGGQETK